MLNRMQMSFLVVITVFFLFSDMVLCAPIDEARNQLRGDYYSSLRWINNNLFGTWNGTRSYKLKDNAGMCKLEYYHDMDFGGFDEYHTYFDIRDINSIETISESYGDYIELHLDTHATGWEKIARKKRVSTSSNKVSIQVKNKDATMRGYRILEKMRAICGVDYKLQEIDAEFKSLIKSSNFDRLRAFKSKYKIEVYSNEIDKEIYVRSTNQVDSSSYVKYIEGSDSLHYKNIAKNELFKIASKKNSIGDFVWLIENMDLPSDIRNNAIDGIYSLVENANDLGGFVWFVKSWPDSSKASDALIKVQDLMFEKASDEDTVESYNTYILSHPLSRNVKNATARALEIEEDKYSSLFTSNDKLARMLLIRAKQIARESSGKYGQERYGYDIILNRMYGLLQDKFSAEEATLRFLEAEEFREFVNEFKKTMRGISEILKNIEQNTSNIKSHINNAVGLLEKSMKSAEHDKIMRDYYEIEVNDWRQDILKEIKNAKM